MQHRRLMTDRMHAMVLGRLGGPLEWREVERPYPLRAANAALDVLCAGRLQGAAVLVP